jgi:ADP-heptose:LPS heptosyltransferase
MEILVINLMRLGDLVQSGPVLRRLRAAYPEARLTLLAMDVFRESALLLEEIDRLLLFPSATLAAALDEPGGWPEAHRALRAWLSENLYPPPDMAINLTPNLLGGILAFAAGAPELRGFNVDRTRQVYTSPAWASYALVVAKAREANPFNLADLFVLEAGLTPDGEGLRVRNSEEAQREADAAIQALALPPGAALIGLFPGASRPERQWPPESFARTAHLLGKARPCHFLLFGSLREEALGEVIRSHLPAGQVTSCLGRTSVPALAAHLRRLDLLLTNDTGPMHLAAAVGTPVLALFLATARALDTGPVGAGHLAVEPECQCHPCPAPCAHPRCHALITPEAVAALGLHVLGEKPLPALAATPDWIGPRLSYAVVDPQGCQTYLPLMRRPLSRRDFWLWTHRLAWEDILNGGASPSPELRAWVKQILQTHYLPAADEPGLAVGQEVFALIQQLASEGEQAARQVMELAHQTPPSLARLQRKLEAFGAIDLHLRRLALEFPECASLLEFFFQEQRQPMVADPIPLARELARAYGRLQTMGAVFVKAMQMLARERALAPAPADIGLAREMHNILDGARHPTEDSEWRHAGDYQ